MSSLITAPKKRPDLPDHTQLPDKDDVPVMNSLEQPQSRLLTDALEPVLRRLHPDGNYFNGRDCGLYWRHTDPPLRGCKAPDWFYVPGVEPLPAGEYRRSYVLWQEGVVPQVVLEYASGDGSEEHDQTRIDGKFWVYEQGIGIPYYGIIVVATGQLEMYQLAGGRYELMTENEHGRYAIPPLGVELGVWHGTFEISESDWLRWWDEDGTLLPTGDERAEQFRAGAEQAEGRAERFRAETEQAEARAERSRAGAERSRVEAERARVEAERAEARSERLAAKLREMGVDPDTL